MTLDYLRVGRMQVMRDNCCCTSSIEAAVLEDLGLHSWGHGQLLGANTDVGAAVQHTLGGALGGQGSYRGHTCIIEILP